MICDEHRRVADMSVMYGIQNERKLVVSMMLYE